MEKTPNIDLKGEIQNGRTECSPERSVDGRND